MRGVIDGGDTGCCGRDEIGYRRHVDGEEVSIWIARCSRESMVQEEFINQLKFGLDRMAMYGRMLIVECRKSNPVASSILFKDAQILFPYPSATNYRISSQGFLAIFDFKLFKPTI